MREYKHLSFEEREKLANWSRDGLTITEMAGRLGRSKSTVSRELRRNLSAAGDYWPEVAARCALKRRERECRIERCDELKDFIINQLRCHFWSPEQIAGFLTHRQEALPAVSHETIYAWIYNPLNKNEALWKCLTRRKRKRGLRSSKNANAVRIVGRVSIHERPKHIDSKENFGHWEGDLVSFQKNSQHMLVLRERTSMYTLISVLAGKNAEGAAHTIIDLLKTTPPPARQTLTLDNGGEFAKHEKVMQELGLKIYFCDPYASWQKGGVENTNGRLRRDFPRSTNVIKMLKEDFDEVAENYNSTPRKSLGWFTPEEVFLSNCQKLTPRVATHA